MNTHVYILDGGCTDVLELQHELLNAVQRTVTLYAKRVNPHSSVTELKRMIGDYMLKKQGEAFSNVVSSVPATAEYLWTSGKKHKVVHNLEFCTVLNAIIRADLANELEVTDLSNNNQTAITHTNLHQQLVNNRLQSSQP